MKNPAAIRDFINDGRAPAPWSQGFYEGTGRAGRHGKRGAWFSKSQEFDAGTSTVARERAVHRPATEARSDLN